MGRKEDLEQHIRESYDLIREYEEIVRLSSDPKEKARARRVIEEQRELIQSWLPEHRQLGGDALPDYITKLTGSPPEPPPDISPAIGEPHLQVQEQVPLLGYVFVILLGLDLILALMLGWRFLGNQPALLSYLEVVTGVLGIGLEILLLGIIIQRKMSITDILRWLGTSYPWQGAIVIVTVVLVIVAVWPQQSETSDRTITQQPAATQQGEVKPAPVVTSTPSTPLTATQWAGPCHIESFEAQPPSPQPVGSLVIFKIRGTCESGVRAIRLLINDEWHDEKGGHIAPAEEFVPAWLTKDLPPGDYKITAEVATWVDEEWEFAGRETLTYTLTAPSIVGGGPVPTAIQPWFGPISFCLQLDAENRCVSPASRLPAGTTRFYASWPFRDTPLGTRFRRIWYKDGELFKSIDDVWDEDWNSPTGVEYTFFEHQYGFPNGQYTLRLYLEDKPEPIQEASVWIGP
jgi:hypothetical protein